jgi:hypothetical protein
LEETVRKLVFLEAPLLAIVSALNQESFELAQAGLRRNSSGLDERESSQYLELQWYVTPALKIELQDVSE